MRDTFTRTLCEIARTDPRVLLLTGDLGFGALTPFATEFPDQFINVGVAEQNLTGLATGLALSGHTVFTYSIGNFPTLRCLEQVRNDVCYHGASVKIVSIGAGLGYGALGFSHHATEDISIMRALPEITVFSPCDSSETAAATRAAYATAGPCYLRIDKSAALTDADLAEPIVMPGPIRCVRRGTQVVIFGTGSILGEVLLAANELASSGIECGVYSIHTIKPLDADGIARVARQAQVVVTVEEHALDGGLGAAVAEALADAGAMPSIFKRFGLRNSFATMVGGQSYLRKQYGLDAASILSDLRRTV